MTYDTLEDVLKNVRLTCLDIYTGEHRENIERKFEAFDAEALEKLLAIQPGRAWEATIVLKRDFELINETLIIAGSPVVASSPHYQAVAAIIRAILPDAPSRAAFDVYIQGRSYIYSHAIVMPWTPVHLLLTLYGKPAYDGSVMLTLSCI